MYKMSIRPDHLAMFAEDCTGSSKRVTMMKVRKGSEFITTVFCVDILVSSYFRHFGSDDYSFILASLIFATSHYVAKNKHNNLLLCL